MRRALLPAVTTAFVLSVSIPAAANGRFPASNQLVFSPSDNNLLVLRTSYGLLPSHDNGASWGFICENALGLGPQDTTDPSIGLTANNSLIAGLQYGLNVSTDVGCNWNCIAGSGSNALSGEEIADIAVRPDAPASAVAITNTYVTTDSSTSIHVQVYETTDNGVTWTALGNPIGKTDPTIRVQTIDVAKTDPKRLYVSGTRSFGAQRTASIFMSIDKGFTWREFPLPASQFDPTTEDSIYIGAIDPTNADRVYVRSSGQLTGGQSRLTVLTGASGASPTFATAQVFDVEAGFAGEATGELLGLAVSPDGSKIWVGTKEEGLWMAATSDLKFTKKSSVLVQCLATRGNELWACSAEVSRFVAGVSTDDGATFTAKLPVIGDLTGPIACAPTDGSAAACNTSQNSSQCGPAYETFCSYYTCGAPEGGTGDDEEKATAPPAKSSSQCNVSFLGVCRCGGGAMLAGGVAILGVAVRRRRKRR